MIQTLCPGDSVYLRFANMIFRFVISKRFEVGHGHDYIAGFEVVPYGGRGSMQVNELEIDWTIQPTKVERMAGQ